MSKIEMVGDEMEVEFRVRVSLEQFFSDERARVYMWCRRGRTVRSLARRLRRVFGLPRRLALVSQGHLLPPDEPLAVLQPDDPVQVIPSSILFPSSEGKEKHITVDGVSKITVPTPDDSLACVGSSTALASPPGTALHSADEVDNMSATTTGDVAPFAEDGPAVAMDGEDGPAVAMDAAASAAVAVDAEGAALADMKQRALHILETYSTQAPRRRRRRVRRRRAVAGTQGDEALPLTDDAPPLTDEALQRTDDAPPLTDEALQQTDDAPPLTDEALQLTDEALQRTDDAPPLTDKAPPSPRESEMTCSVAVVRLEPDAPRPARLVRSLNETR